jgi:hypothetical protein
VVSFASNVMVGGGIRGRKPSVELLLLHDRPYLFVIWHNRPFRQHCMIEKIRFTYYQRAPSHCSTLLPSPSLPLPELVCPTSSKHPQRRSCLVASLGIFLEKLESRPKNAGDELTPSPLFDLHCRDRKDREDFHHDIHHHVCHFL